MVQFRPTRSTWLSDAVACELIPQELAHVFLPL